MRNELTSSFVFQLFLSSVGFWWFSLVKQMLRLLRGPVGEWKDFPGGSESKQSACSAGDLSSVPGSGRSPGEGNSYPLSYLCLKNSMDRGDWWATYSSWGHRDSDTTERLTLWLFQESEIDLLCLLFLWRRKSFCLIYTSWVLIKGKPDFTFLSQKSDWQKCLFSFLSDLFHYLSDWDLVNWRGLEVLRA